MPDAVELSAGRRFRRWRSVSEKLEIVQLTLKSGASVAEVARAHGMNANQLFKWHRAFKRGELCEPGVALIPVTVANPEDESREAAGVATPSGGAIQIFVPGGSWITCASSPG